ncbi:hypothetical protein [Phormidesmis priestleyi]
MAVKLAVPPYLGATVIFAFEFWRYSVMGAILFVTGNNAAIFFFTVSSIGLLLAFVWFLILIGIYALLLKFLWSNPPKFFSLPGFKSLVIRDFGILVISLLPIVAIF